MSGRHSYRGPMNGRGQRTNTKLGVRPISLAALERVVAPLLEVFVPGVLENPLNGKLARAHWSAKSKWSNSWKGRTWAVLRTTSVLAASRDALLGLTQPKHIHFEAHTGAPWDDDAIPAGCKPARDALIGALIHSDGPTSGHLFTYSQVVDRKQRGVKITVRRHDVLGGQA